MIGPYILTGFAMLIILGFDFMERRIPNQLVLLILFAGIYVHPNISTVTNLLIAIAFFLPFYLIGGIGGGDFKLMMALSALTGYYDSMLIYIFGVIPCIIFISIKKLSEGQFGKFKNDTVFGLKLMAMGQTSQAVKLTSGETVPLGCWLSVGYYIWLIMMAY